MCFVPPPHTHTHMLRNEEHCDESVWVGLIIYLFNSKSDHVYCRHTGKYVDANVILILLLLLMEHQSTNPSSKKVILKAAKP